MAHGYLPRRDIKNHLWNKKKIEARGAISLCEIDDFILESSEAANSACKNYPNAIRVGVILRDVCIRDCLVTGDQCNLSKPVYLPSFFAIQEICGFESFDFTSKTCFEFGRVKKSDHFCTGHPINQSIPVIVDC